MKNKKIIVATTIFMMLLMTFGVLSQAITSDQLAEELYAKGSKYGMSSSDKVKIERYLSENPVTEEEASQILAKAEEAIAVMENAGETRVKKRRIKKYSKISSKCNRCYISFQNKFCRNI